MKRWLAGVTILALSAVGYSGCESPENNGQPCADGKGHWIEDESDSLKSGYTVVVRICVDDGGNVIDMEVD